MFSNLFSTQRGGILECRCWRSDHKSFILACSGGLGQAKATNYSGVALPSHLPSLSVQTAYVTDSQWGWTGLLLSQRPTDCVAQLQTHPDATVASHERVSCSCNTSQLQFTQ